MDSAEGNGSIEVIARMLETMRKKGLALWSQGGELHYRAPKGAFTRQEIETLRSSKPVLIALLEQTTRAPLAFSQLAHWHAYGLGRRGGIRQIAGAMRLRGRLNVAALGRSIAELVRRHDALRTRIVVVDGCPVQEVSASGRCDLPLIEIGATAASDCRSQLQSIIEELILEPVDLAVGPLLATRLVKLDEGEHVLIVAMEHSVSDAFSRGIFMRELLAAYSQAALDRDFSLPPVRIQFPEYARRQRNEETSWVRRHGSYWSGRLQGGRRVRFPPDRTVSDATRIGWSEVPIHIDADTKARLLEWCRLKRTTVVMAIFAVYVALVLRWCEVSDCVFQYESDGRMSPDVHDTIGYFASVLYLRIELGEDDRFIDVIRRATTEYCHAFEHADLCYLAAQVPRPEFARNTGFNWVPYTPPADPGSIGGEAGHDLEASPVRFAHPMLKNFEADNEPSIRLYETPREIVGGVYFPLNRFSAPAMAGFARNFANFVEVMLRQSDRAIRDIDLQRG